MQHASQEVHIRYECDSHFLRRPHLKPNAVGSQYPNGCVHTGQSASRFHQSIAVQSLVIDVVPVAPIRPSPRAADQTICGYQSGAQHCPSTSDDGFRYGHDCHRPFDTTRAQYL